MRGVNDLVFIQRDDSSGEQGRGGAMKKPKFTRAEETLIIAGEKMSNVFFNLGQNNGVLSRYKDCQVEWDKARAALYAERNAKANRKEQAGEKP